MALVRTCAKCGMKVDNPSISRCPNCQEMLGESEADAQRRQYQEKADKTGKEFWWRGEKFTPKAPLAEGSPVYCKHGQCAELARQDGFCTMHTPPPPGTRQYKVITQRDEFFAGKFDPAKLEELVNKLALDGWRVVSVATADVSTFFGTFWSGRGARQEIVVFLERA